MKKSLKKNNRKFILFSAFITLLNDRLSESILLPILPSFVLLFDAKASTYGLLSCTYQLAQFIASPFIGLMSDRYGRRPVTLFCITGSIIGISILSFTVLYEWPSSAFGTKIVDDISNSETIIQNLFILPLILLFIARLIDGLSGGTAATATTILADISSPEKRAKTFGLIGVAFGLSFFLGNIFVVIFAKNTNNNFIIPVLIASIIPVINFLLVLFYLPETKPRSEFNTETNQILRNPLKQLFNVFKEDKIRKLSLAFFIYFIAFTGLTNILIFFLQESLKWTTKASSGTLVVVGVIAIIVQGVLIGPLVKKFGEMKLTLIGSGFILFACLLLISSPTTGAVKYIYTAVSCLAVGAGLITPSLRALISKKLDEGKQGSILSNLQGLQSLGGVLGISMAGKVYDEFGPRSPFVAGAIILIIMIYLISEGKNKKIIYNE